MSTLTDLETLVSSLFDANEFRTLLRRAGYEGELFASLPAATTAPATQVIDTLAALHRRGLLDGSFFEHLRQARPQRLAEIARVFSAWELSLLERSRSVSSTRVEFVPLAAPLPGWPIELRPGSVFELGRDSTLRHSLPMHDRSASRRHARIVWDARGIELYDLSKNGCWVNSRKTRHAILKHGDRVRLGRTDLLVQDLEGTVTVAADAESTLPVVR